MENLGELIKNARLELHLRQRDVAKVLGVERTTVSNWECGRAEPDLHMLRELSKVLQHNLFGDHAEFMPFQEQSSRKLRLKLSDSPMIEVISPENASICTAGSFNLLINGVDLHGNPVNYRISANFSVDNNGE